MKWTTQAILGWTISALLAYASVASPAQAQLLDTKAKQAYMIDAITGTVLFEKDADKPVPPASLAKMMTMEVVFQSVKSGRHSLTEVFKVSENAWRKGGAPSGTSTMFAVLKSSIPLEDLVRATIIQSANDACIIIAEGFAGSEEGFATLMNERAKVLGLKGSTFRNSTGLPDAAQRVTMRDLVKLGAHIWREYPEFYKIYSEREFTWNKIVQRNRNPLLALDIGADGMKTGFTEESGYAIVGSAERDGMRLFMAMSGLATDKERAEEARKMLEWGQSAFTKIPLFHAREVIGEASVFGGMKAGVQVGPEGPVATLVTKENRLRLKAHVSYNGPLIAPLQKGQEIGQLKVYSGDVLIQVSPVVALEDVAVGSLTDRALSAAKEIATGWIRQL
jgi:serine-type D-Ala-D-Ala carboxypeptidase (penicillin-binding protein 5/6)